MPELLLELLSEEIPARMQKRASEDLKKVVTDGLIEAGLFYEAAKAFVTPRRLTLFVSGVPAKTEDTVEDRRGPKVGAPEKAVQGFLGSAGLTLDQVEERETDKGAFYFALIERQGRAAADIISDLMPDIVRAFPWPKSQRWGAASTTMESLRWVRPLHSILCILGVRAPSRRSSISKWAASNPAISPAATGSWRRTRSRSAGSRTMWPS